MTHTELFYYILQLYSLHWSILNKMKKKDISVEVLVAAMHQSDKSLLDRMRIETDAIIGNQCDGDSIERFEWNGNNIIYLNFSERGVGLNRNNAMIRARGDICLLADEDIIYVKGYANKVRKAFSRFGNADVIIFNIYEKPVTRYVIKHATRVWWHNFLRYGAVRIAFRRESIVENGIYFNQNFGGGCQYQHGEDNIFLAECLSKGLKVYAVPVYIAMLTPGSTSTWRKGYTEKYFSDQGRLYRTIFKRWWKLISFQDAIRHQNLYKKNWLRVFWEMLDQKGN